MDLLLIGRVRLADALNHLYVLLPVLDDGMRYRVLCRNRHNTHYAEVRVMPTCRRVRVQPLV